MGLAEQLQRGIADRYRLEGELGRGGMATVFLAQDLRHKRPVALKVLHPELAHTLGPERFRREIEVVARLQHPHILPVHDSGEVAGLRRHMASDHAPGNAKASAVAVLGTVPRAKKTLRTVSPNGRSAGDMSKSTAGETRYGQNRTLPAVPTGLAGR